jgi:hypothetical protein
MDFLGDNSRDYVNNIVAQFMYGNSDESEIFDNCPIDSVSLWKHNNGRDNENNAKT